MAGHSDGERDTTHFRAIGGESESVYEAIFREVEDAVFFLDVERADDDYTFTYRRNNASHQQRTGLSEDEFRGQTPRELLGDEQGREVAANYRRCVEQRDTIEYEETLTYPGGTSHWQTKLTPLTENGEVTQIVGVARDITEQQERERERRRKNRRFETVLETMSAAVFLKDVDGQYPLMNQACRELFDIDGDDEITGLTDQDLFPPERVQSAQADDRRIIEAEEPIEIEETVPTARGKTVRVTRKSPVYDEEGTVEAICGVSTDITAQKERERELERTQTRLETLNERFELAIDGANLGVWDWDMQTDDVEFNDNWATMLGYEPGEISSRLEEWERRVHPDDVEPVEEALEEHIAGETDYYDTEHRMRTADGDWKWIRDVGKVFERDEDGNPIRAVGIHIDVDERKRAQRALREERDMFAQGPAVLFKWKHEDHWPVEYVSENVEAVLGYTPETLESGELTFAEIVHEDDLERVRRDVETQTDSGAERFSHEPYRVLTADGDVRWVLDNSKNVRDGAEVTHRLGYLVDVTERKEYEQTLERQRNSLEVLNQIVRHDVRNDLQVMLSYGGLLEDHVSDDQEGADHLRQVLEAARNAVDITKTAGDVTEVLLRSEPDRTPVSVRQALQEQVEDIRASHESAIVSVDGTIPAVEVLADDMLESVFRNLLNNAITHNDKEIPEIDVSGTADDETVTVRVADNGPGIPDNQQERIFEKGEKALDSDGTGLGLYLVRTLTDRYGGDISVEENEPDGSVFVVELPRSN
jgi:PAS domain S-box-containing protein